MKSTATLAKVVLAAIILISFTGTAAARNISRAVAQPDQIVDAPIDSDEMRLSNLWEAFPQPPQFDPDLRYPNEDFGFYEPEQMGKNPTQAVKQPEQFDADLRYPYEDFGFYEPEQMGKNPTEAVKQPEQCDDICVRLPVEAVPQPQQCDVIFVRLPVEAVKQPDQCDPIRKNPSQAVKQPDQCDPIRKNPSQAVPQPMAVECNGPTMRLTLKDAAATEIAIYSVNGRLIRRISEQLDSGETELTWDGRSDSGARAASGVYFAQVQAGGEFGKGKLVLVR